MKKLASFGVLAVFLSETGFSREPVLKPASVLGVSKLNDKCNYYSDISYVL